MTPLTADDDHRAQGALKAVEEIYRLGPPLLALARRLPPEDAELIHRVIGCLPYSSPSR